jgi:hypothetical protein
MNSKQLARLEHLDSVEFQTPAEEAEHAHLLHLHSDICAAFALLTERDMQPTWVGGEYIMAGGCMVRSLSDARRLVNCQ